MGVPHYVRWVYLAPALAIVGIYLVWPTIQTVILSFMGPHGSQFVGLSNYLRWISQPETWITVRNNVLWFLLLPTATVGLGLAFAVLFERVRYESLAKSAVFLPMVVSFVGAGVIWKFVYAYVPEIYPQIGLLNAIRSAFGMSPLAWLAQRPFLNNALLILVAVWAWSGFPMIVFSAVCKGINRDMTDAARIDGANEWQVFRHVMFPQLKPTVLVVFTIMAIISVKVFDVVYVMTGGGIGTNVLANRMYQEMFEYHDFGMASAIAVILLVVTLPLVIMATRVGRTRRA